MFLKTLILNITPKISVIRSQFSINWLVLNNAPIPTEAQVLEQKIEEHTAKNIPKKKTNKKKKLARRSSQVWPLPPVQSGRLSIEHASKKEKVTNQQPKPKKPPPKSTKKKPSDKQTDCGFSCIWFVMIYAMLKVQI